MSDARTIPADSSARLLKNLRTFVASIDSGLSSPAADPAQTGRWRRAVDLLRRDLTLATAAAEQATTGPQDSLIAQASNLRFLARRMDGYKLDFAGPELAERLAAERQLTVLVAWQIYAKATGSNASGL